MTPATSQARDIKDGERNDETPNLKSKLPVYKGKGNGHQVTRINPRSRA